MKYNERETLLTTVYLLDQGEKEIGVYQDLWNNQELTMDNVSDLALTFRSTTDYKDLYPIFSQEYDLIAGHSPMDYFKNEKLDNLDSVQQFFSVANERKINPEKILKASQMDDFTKSEYYKTHWGKTLEFLGKNRSMSPWERLVADTIYFHNKSTMEKDRFISLMISNEDSFTKKEYAKMLLHSKEDLKQTMIHYQDAFNASPPIREAISKIASSNNPDEIAAIIQKYENDEETISDVVSHLLSRERKEEKEETMTTNLPLPNLGISNPQIMSALALTIYFRQYIGESFGRVSLGASVHLSDNQITDLMNAYLQHIDSEIMELNKTIASQERHSEMYRVSLEEKRYRLHELQDISIRGHLIMNSMMANTELRNQLEHDINRGNINVTDIRRVGTELKEAPDIIRNNHFKNVYGYELENLYGRELSKVDIYIILSYKEFLCSRIDAAEARMETMTIRKQPEASELQNLLRGYVVDSKLLESVNESLNQYKKAMSGVTLPGIVQLVYQPNNGTLSTRSTIEIGQSEDGTWVIDPFINENQAKQFIKSFTEKCAGLKINSLVSYSVLTSEIMYWNQVQAWKNYEAYKLYQTSTFAEANKTKLPANLRSDMKIFKETEKQYLKYIDDIKYDMAHPEFIGQWQTDENYQDLRDLIKKEEKQTIDKPLGYKRS